MPPQPLTVNYRITFNYTVSSFPHKQHMYVECSPSGDASGFNTVARTGFTGVGISTVDTPWWTKLAPYFDSTLASFDNIVLESRSGSSWVFVYSKLATVAPSGAGVDPAMGMCVAQKDALNRACNTYVFEGAFGVTSKHASYAGLGTNGQALANALGNAGGTAVNVDPYAWRRTKDAALTGRWLSIVVDSNEKLRRLRRIK